MTLRYIVAPAPDRTLFRRVLQRLDEILGYPRTHTEAETGVNRGAKAPLPVTDAAFVVWVHDAVTDAPILHGAVAAQVDDVGAGLNTRFVEFNAVRKRLSAWIADQGWEVRPDLPGTRAAWSRVTHRDGATGSATGVPIPEGSE